MKNKIKYRYESFGGIISSHDPSFLAFVDREYMLNLGAENSPLWQNEKCGPLSAPTEVHFSITNRCHNKCLHCYRNSGITDESELTFSQCKDVIDELARMNIFHIAMGGGDALLREDLFDIALYAKKKGIIPNLTISGRKMNSMQVKNMRVFGQVNVSLDGIYDYNNIYRKNEYFQEADKVIYSLLKAGIYTGINCVLSKRNFKDIEGLVQYAVDKGVAEIEFLRLKPSGRGKKVYLKEKMTPDQNRVFYPFLLELSEKYKIDLKVDCSFIPMICYHKPDKDFMKKMAVYGCEAGNILLGINSQGQVSGCSFLSPLNLKYSELKNEWYQNEELNRVRSFRGNAQEPCSQCEYLDICKGGCHAVAQVISGDINAPDPDCPRVQKNLK